MSKSVPKKKETVCVGTHVWLQSHTPLESLSSSLIALQGKVGTTKRKPHTELCTHTHTQKVCIEVLN